RSSLAAAGSAFTRGDDRSGEPAVQRARATAGGCRELPAAQSQRAIQSPDGRPLRNREPNCRRTHALQRSNPGLQHVASAISREHHGTDVRLQGISLLRGASRSPEGAQGQLHAALTNVQSPLPWERILWTARPLAARRTAYGLTDVRVYAARGGRVLEMALQDVGDVEHGRSRLDRLLGTSTVTVHARDARWPPVSLRH